MARLRTTMFKARADLFCLDAIWAVGIGSALLIAVPPRCIARQELNSTSRLSATCAFDTPGTRLEGTLTWRTFYGPPGFGETPAQDARERVLVLQLRVPITVVPVKDAEARNSPNLDVKHHVLHVQLFVPDEQAALARKLVRKKVVAVGTLDEALAPGQHTDATMDVQVLAAESNPNFK